jgi:hypothetical protein
VGERRRRRYWTPYKKNQLAIGVLIVLASGFIALSAFVIVDILDNTSGRLFLGTRWR